MDVRIIWAKFNLELGLDCLVYGWKGPGNLIKQLTIKDIKELSTNMLSSIDVSNLKTIASLLIENDEYEINTLLESISNEITEVTKLKWHIVLLIKHMIESKSMQGSYRDKAEHIYTYWFYSDFYNEIPFNKSPLCYQSKGEFYNLIKLNHKYLLDKLAQLRT